MKSGPLEENQQKPIPADLRTFALVYSHQRAIMSSRSELKSQDVPKFFSPVSGRTRRKAPASSQLETAEEDSPSKTGRAQPSLDDNNNFFKLLESMQLDESFEHPTTSYSTTYSAKFSLLPEISPPSSEYTDDLPPADDEQTVNAALVDFLKALTMHFQIPMEWSFRRRAFFCNDTKGRGFEARVDGCLRQINSDIPLAIVKVKSCIRENHIEAIRMQEGAQMAAWISSYPDFCSRHKQKDKKRT